MLSGLGFSTYPHTSRICSLAFFFFFELPRQLSQEYLLSSHVFSSSSPSISISDCSVLPGYVSLGESLHVHCL
jgi:hypothetical protein